MDEQIAALVAAGRGAVSATGLTAAGVARREVERAVGRGDLVRIRRNCLVDGAAWGAAAPWERHALRARAIAVGTPGQEVSVLTHHSALAVWGVALHGVDDKVHLSRTDGGRGSTDATVRAHRAVPPAFITEHAGLRLVTPAAACLQVAARFGPEAGLVASDDALHRELCTMDDLERAHGALGVTRSSRGPGLVLRLTDGRIESAAESRARWAFHMTGMAQPRPQVVVRDERDRFVARVDFLIEELGVVIEVDGMGKYGDIAAVRSEKLREDRLRELGYEVVRLTWADLANPALVRDKVERAARRAMQRRSA